MTWSELNFALSSIPEHRRYEPAVFVSDGQVFQIDNIDMIVDNELTWGDLADNSIYPENDVTHDLPPINLTP